MKAIIVDDSRAMRMIIKRILAAVGFEVCEAGDGKQALDQLVATGPVDLALVDWNMPVMNGLDFLRQLRAEPGGDFPKVVFCTVESDPGRIREALAAGASEYIMKPFDGDIIAAKFAEAGLA